MAAAACGANVLTAIPSAPASTPRLAVQRSRNALLPPYMVPIDAGPVGGNGGPSGGIAVAEERLMIHPSPRSRIWGRTSRMSFHGTQKLSCRIFSIPLSDQSIKGLKPPAAALFTRMSMVPSFCSTLATRCERSLFGSLRSNGIPMIFDPVDSRSATACSRVPRSASPGCGLEQIATEAPSAARRWAIAFPIPRLAPVTSATRPSHDRPMKISPSFVLSS